MNAPPKWRSWLAALIAAMPLTVALSAIGLPAQAGTQLVAVSAAIGQVVPGQYIVTLKSGSAGSAVAERTGIVAQQVHGSVLTGFAATLTDVQLRALQRNPSVAAIEPNQIVYALTVQTPTPSWGLDRIDQRRLPLNNRYVYGHGTHVAGTLGSTSYGVAKRVALRGVRVLNCSGSGTIADVIEGVDWAARRTPRWTTR